MGTPLTLYFQGETSFYNAVNFANLIGEKSKPGEYDITLKYCSSNAPDGKIVDLQTFGAGKTAQQLRDDVFKDLTDTSVLANEIYSNTILTPSGRLVGGVYRLGAYGYAPRIEHDMTIDFRDKNNAASSFSPFISRYQFIDSDVNGRDFVGNGLISQADSQGVYSAGFKIDDGNDNRQINVTFLGLSNGGPQGTAFLQTDFPPSEDRTKFADFAVLVDNSENLTINGFYAGPTTVVGNLTKPPITAAQVVNRRRGNLTLTGDVTVAPAHNYTNSLAFNQGAFKIENANIRVFDKNSTSRVLYNKRYGATSRAIGAIDNAGSLEIINSKLWQEADNKVSPVSLTDSEAYNENVFGVDKSNPAQFTPNWTDPSPLEYLISNSGTTTIDNSQISGIVRQQWSDTAVLSLKESKLGYAETPVYENLIIDKGSWNVDGSTIDRVSTSIRPSNRKNSVILSSGNSVAVAPSVNSAYRLLDPTRPSLFAAQREDLTSNTGGKSQFWGTSYDPKRLDPAVLAAINAALQVTGAASPVVAPNPGHVTGYSATWGTVLTDQSVKSDQTLTITTENLADGAYLLLNLNGVRYRESVKNNQATFGIPKLDLQALPYGLDVFTLAVEGDPSIPSQPFSFSRAHGLTGTGSGSSAAMISSINPSFGSIIHQGQLSGHSLTIQTSGLPQGTQLGLSIDGQAVSSAGGGVVGANGVAKFTLPVDALAALGLGVHRFSITGQGASSGLNVGTVSKAFTIAADAQSVNPTANPHIDLVTASFGSVLDQQEEKSDQQVIVDTSGFSNGDKLTVRLGRKSYEGVVRNETATIILPAADLANLQSGSTPRIMVTGSNRAGIEAPEHDYLFAVDGSVSLSHIVDIVPSFGSALDQNEAKQQQSVLVRTDGFSDGDRLTLQLDGKNYTSVTTGNRARFSLSAAALKIIPVGVNRLSIKPADSSVLDAELAFTVVKGVSSVKGSVTGVRLRGSKTRKDYEGTILADRITGNKKNNSILGLNDADRLYGKKGRDIIDAGAGDDYIVGGFGGDILRGREGADVFSYKSWKDSKAGKARNLDAIVDFEIDDRIDLSRLKPRLTYVGESSFTGQAGELRFAQSVLGADMNGDKVADFLIGINSPSLVETQLIL